MLGIWHKAHIFNIGIVVNCSEHLVGKISFYCIIEFVSIHMVSSLFESSMYPIGMVNTISIFIMINPINSLSHVFSIQSWIERIFGSIKDANERSSTNILFTSIILIELTCSKLLISIISLILSSYKLFSMLV